MKAFDGSHGYGIIGLSFGIEERDIWGELVTQKFQIPVKLYDCPELQDSVRDSLFEMRDFN